VSLSIRSISALGLAALAAPVPRALAQEVLDVERYVEIVKRAHPGAAQRAGLQQAAEAEGRTARLLSDPVFGIVWDRARPIGGAGASAGETGYSLTQTLPWPGTRRAGIAAAEASADAFRADADTVSWQIEASARLAYTRLEVARGQLEGARAAEADARSLRDLVARRADLGESRESDRIRASVEWLRQQRQLAAAEREAELSESILRALAVEPLSQPLTLKPTSRSTLPAFDAAALASRLLEANPRLRAARAEAARRTALVSLARRARIPDLDVSVFRQREIDKESDGFSVGIKVPLWNANRGEIARAAAMSRAATAAAERERLDTRVELETRLTDLRVAADQAALVEVEVLPQARQSLSLARLSYEEGETSLLDLLDAQRTFRETERERLRARLAEGLALAEVQRLAGPAFDPWRPDR
jgi:cobalt-zinc-cadmium efflux system outer membrane protein